MKSRLFLLLLAWPAADALAQYKCIAAGGAVTFQQTPCADARLEEKRVVVPNRPPVPASGVAAAPPAGRPAASAPADSVDKRMLANYAHQHERDALELDLREAQADKARRAAQRAQDVAAVQKRFGDDPADAASLRDALAAIGSRYDALALIDDGRVRAAQAALDEWDRAPPRRPPP